MNQATTAIASRHYAEQAAGGDQEAIEQVYFHLVRGEQPPPLGEAEAPPASARVWKGEDWLDTAPDGLFTSYCGDCQPRAADGEVLQTAERLAIAAARARDGMHGPEAWANVDATAGADAIWIAATGERGAIRVAQVAETDQHSAMRDLSGKNGYGRARGTENIDRPDQKARTAALALHVDEIARGSGIELARDDRSEAIDGQLARLEVHADGGTRATLGRGWAPTPSIPDLVDEATAVAVARAYHHAEPGAERRRRADVAGIVAGHHLVQSAGIRTLGTTHEAKIAAWRDGQRGTGPDAARNEARAVVALIRKTEADLAWPRTQRDFKRWERRAAARGDEAPVPAGTEQENKPMQTGGNPGIKAPQRPQPQRAGDAAGRAPEPEQPGR